MKRWPIGIQGGVTGATPNSGKMIKELTEQGIAMFWANSDGMANLYTLQEARRHTGVPHTANLCLTGYEGNYHLSVPINYRAATQEEWDRLAVEHWDMVEKRGLPKELDFSIPCIWLSTWNEVRGYTGWGEATQPRDEWDEPIDGFSGYGDLLGWQAVAIGKEAVRRGYRWMAFGFAGGNPETDIWESAGMLAYLRLCEQYPDQLGIALHEYSLTNQLIKGWGEFQTEFANSMEELNQGQRLVTKNGIQHDHIGRFYYLHQTCDRHGIARPRIHIKEFGWRHRWVPEPQEQVDQLLYAAYLYMKEPNIDGAAIWTAQGKGWGDVHKTVGLYTVDGFLTKLALENAQPIPQAQPKPSPQPSPPPAQEKRKLILSQYFNRTDDNKDWEDISQIQQQPKGWLVKNAEGENKLGGGVWSVPEAIYRWRENIPAHEHDDVLNKGRDPLGQGERFAYKIFSRHRSWWTRLTAPSIELEAGTYTLRLLYFCDALESYHPHKKGAPDPLSFEAAVGVETPSRGEDIHIELAAHDGERLIIGDNEVIHTFTIDSRTKARPFFWLRGRWGILNNGAFVKEFELWKEKTAVEEPPDPDPSPEPEKRIGDARVPYNRRVYRVSSKATEEQYLAVCRQAMLDNRAAVVFSPDDAAIGYGLKSKTVIEVGGEYDPQLIEEWYRHHYGVSQVEHMTFINNKFEFTHYPTEYLYVTQKFGANPENYRPFGWEGGHEGKDLRAPYGSKIFCVAAGVIKLVTNKRLDGKPSNYGWHVRVIHERSDGIFETIYAHLDPEVASRWRSGQEIQGGDVIGLSGNTGNSRGPHLHLTLKRKGAQLAGHLAEIINPWPYLAKFFSNGDTEQPQPPEPVGKGYATLNLNFRSTPYVRPDNIIRVLSKNEAVDILERGAWHKLQDAAGNVGFAASRYIKEGDPPSPNIQINVETRLGLHTSADGGFLYGQAAEHQEFKTLRPSVIKVLSNIAPESLRRLHADQMSIGNSNIIWLIRAFLGGMHDRNISPDRFFNDTINDVRRTVLTLKSLGAGHSFMRIELHNEPNLYDEGLGSSWGSGSSYNSWGLNLLKLYREKFLNDIPYLYGGLSPGIGAKGVRQDSKSFLSQSKGYAQACDAIGVHAYWSSAAPQYSMDHAVNQVAEYGRMFPDKEIWVTEASRNDRPSILTPSQYGREYKEFWRRIAAIPNVAGVTYFVASASNPFFEPETWVSKGRSKGIAQQIRVS